MYKIAFKLAVRILVPVYLCLGLPLLMFTPAAFYYHIEGQLQQQAEKSVEIFAKKSDYLEAGRQLYLQLQAKNQSQIYLRISPPDSKPFFYGAPIKGFGVKGEYVASNGMGILIIQDGVRLMRASSACIMAMILIMALVGVIIVWICYRFAHRLSKPLVLLSAQAEQLGGSSLRPIRLATGIEEMDLVSAEMSRVSQRFAAQLAQQRQFAADVTHQLRTPLASISMRVEEIKFLSEANSPTDQECDECLAQVERMNQAMDTLKNLNNQALLGKTEAINLGALFTQQAEEWEKPFALAGRKLIFDNPVVDRYALATPGSLSQALATIIENALKYGRGVVSVTTRSGSTDRSIFIEITDEGAGISEEVYGNIFLRGVSGSGSTGIGLALAKELIEADGGRLELTQKAPPVFTISLCALPASYVQPQ